MLFYFETVLKWN